ncbi:Protein CSF1 [Penicillium rolfsii]|nr:Protein CSF1 [Penicillium rolfsii]
MASTSLTASYLTPDPSFNCALFFLFYFNRLFATLLSYAIRAYTWHYYRVYVDIKALQISLLGGRIFFKGIRYQGVNETIFIHGGFITWRYWKRTVERTDLSHAGYKGSHSKAPKKDQSEAIPRDLSDKRSGEEGGIKKTIELPCRISITAYGLEWFIYNRTPAYDSILAGFGYKHANLCEDDGSIQSPLEAQSEPHGTPSTSNVKTENAAKSTPDNMSEDSMDGGQNLDPRKTEIRDSELSQPVSALLQLLPVKLDCRKGAIVMGNENTRSVLTTTFDNAQGTIAASNAGPLDLYRQLFSLEFDHPVIQMRPNPDFKQSQITTAKTLGAVKEEISRSERKRYPFSYKLQKRKIWHSVRELVPYFQTSVESFHASIRQTENLPRSQAEFPEVRWAGLSRYLDEESDDDHEKWNSVEYGRFSTILDSPRLHLVYFWDIPGRVGPELPRPAHLDQHTDTNINHALPPEWEIDLKIDGGDINYGPWADRERVGLQNVFFPNFYRSSEPAEKLAPEVLRQSTVFRLRVEINKDLTVRIPTREPSKDWMWKGRADAIRGGSKARKQAERRKHRSKEGEKGYIGPDIRPFGWLSLRIGPDSTVNYTMDMVASSIGFRNELSLDLRESKMSSSVNHGLLWQCPRHLVTCDLSNPLIWNNLRSWRFTVESQDMELYLLRDHIFLLTDLVSDWASGPPSDYHTFVPFIYHMNLTFSNLQLFINVNDRNIISNPSDLEDNRFIVIKGKHLTSNILIPLNKYQPEQNAVEFKVVLEDGGVDYLIPLWDTLHAFLPGKSMATLESLFINGSYNYFSATSSELIDTLVLDISGVSPRLYLYGFLIKSFMAVRENYFGDEMHFKTLEEYQELAYADAQPSNPTGINPNRKSNDMDVLVHVTVDRPCALLPESIYDNSRCSHIYAASLEVDLRFTNYYMDMQLSISPLKLGLEFLQPDGSCFISSTQLFIDGLSAYGHRLFGLPPAEPTYVCNWDFDVGKILGECSTEFLACLASGLKSFDFSFDNEENALHPLFQPTLFDVTFLRANIASIHISVLFDEIALILDSQPLSIRFNDWANSKFSKRLSLTAPAITIAAVDRQSVSLSLRMTDKIVSPLGLIEMAIGLKMALRKRDIVESRRLQQEHIKVHDQRTHRAQWLLFDWEEIAPISSLPHGDDTISPPTMPIPSMPEPINEIHRSLNSSYRGFSGTHAAASSRSFLVHSERASLRSVKVSPKDTSRSSSRSEPERRAGPTTWDASRSTVQLSRAKNSAYSSTAVRDANPWIIPHFTYWKLSLDRTELPSSISGENTCERDTDTRANNKSMFLTFEDDQTTYTNLAVNFPLGIRGFCTPKFIHSVALLMDGMEPKHPIQIIDSLQKDVISDIVGYDKAMSQPKKSTSIAVRVPAIQLRLIDVSSCPDDGQVELRDEYIISVDNLRAEIQKRVERHKGDLLNGLKQDYTVHAAADRFWVSVEGSRTGSIEERARFNCDLGDMNFWLVTEPNIRSHLQMRNFNTITSAKCVERLAFLVRRAITMFDSVASAFKHNAISSKQRMRFLIHSLTKSAGGIADPVFLTRISKVLRIASSHLRQHDSWKIISRIRNIYQNLPVNLQRELDRKCRGDNFNLPTDAKSAVLNGFDQWRAWDLAHVDKSYVMRKIWSRPEPKPVNPEPSMSLSCTVKTLRISLDPGPRESDFIVEDLSAVASLIPDKSIQEGKTEHKKVAALQLYSSSAVLRLRWEVVDLVEGVIKVMSPISLESSPQSIVSVPGEQKLTEIQIIFGTDRGSVTLDAINLKLALVSKAIRGSIVHTSQITKKTKNEALSLLFSAEACSSELLSQSRTLMLSKIADPYLYVSLISNENELERKHEWKVAGSCRELRYEMKEDPVSLAHTADRLIEDEIRYIRRLVDDVKLPKFQPDQATGSKKPTQNKMNVAMFLEDYRLSFSLLPSLTYLICGEVARMSVLPTETFKIEIDFDIKKNLHIFTSGEGDLSRNLSTLEMPPANGRILANVFSGRKEVEIDMTIELIRLEASSVRSLLGVLTGPDVSHLISDLKQNVNVLQSHLEETLSLQSSKPEHELVAQNSVILYKSRLTVAGFEVHALAPGLNSTKYSAEMIFSLGMMQMRLQNGLDRSYAMDYPEFSVDASQINFKLCRRENSKSRPYGGISAGIKLQGTSTVRDNGEVMRAYHLTSEKLDIELFAETAALVVDIAIYTQERIKTLDLSHEVERLRRLRHRNQHQDRPRTPLEAPEIHVNDDDPAQPFLNAFYSLEFRDIQVAWNMSTALSGGSPGRQPEDLIFSIKQVELSNKKKNSAKLRIENMQLQMVPFRADRSTRSLNSALMPELVFNVAYYSSGKELWLAFQAAGKSLDIRATSEFIIPANMIRNSIGSASEALRNGKAAWATKPSTDNSNKDSNLFGNRRLRSILVDVDFAGATVSLQGKQSHDSQTLLTATLKGSKLSESKYGQYVQGDSATTATLRAPGVALKVQFEDNGTADPVLNAELKVDPSTNILYPTLVPLVKQMTATVKEIMSQQQQTQQDHPRRASAAVKLQPQKLMQETPFGGPDPNSILGRCKVNLGLLFCKQEFSLSCQPIARVAATGQFESVYVTVNTVQSTEQGRFLALSLAFNSLEASVKHVYSNESTASFEVPSMILSLMNSKHLGRMSGMSAILRVSPMKISLNAKQLQDFLLFREIWLPSDEDESGANSPTPRPEQPETPTYIVQRYQQVASTSVFPWNTTIAAEKLDIALDLGSTLGKAQFAIDNVWVSSSKTSDREQSMCINFDSVGIECKGRMAGIIELNSFKVRTSIKWPEETASHTPLIQASIAFHHLQAKVSFDYQPFLVAHVAEFDFLMYNVREAPDKGGERLFSILEGDEVQVFCTSLTASQTLALFQAWQRLVQDKQSAYEASLREVERYLRRKSTALPGRIEARTKELAKKDEEPERAPGSLHTGVVVNIRHVNLGAFPSSFFDNQIFKIEAHDAQARFDVSLESNKIHSALGLTLGQLRVALSGINRPPSAHLDELSVEEIAQRAAGSRGGTILKVPRLVAGMETWQVAGTRQIDYIFHSSFEGKVDVGWNYSRISFIRDMWESHSRALASRLGKPLPPSAVRITSGPGSGGGGPGEGGGADAEQQDKITAVVNVPQSKYTYTALEPPVIETPQLRDMGEATPPLEWIGLQRDKLPNVTHQIIIVTLLEIAKEVEDAYGTILGT